MLKSDFNHKFESTSWLS